MYKLYKSKSNPSKLQVYIPSYNGSKIETLSSREFKNRSVSGTKLFGVRPLPRSPNSRQKDSKQKIHPKIQINNLNFNLVICNNKQSTLTSPAVISSRNKLPSNFNTKINFFKSNNVIKTLSKGTEAQRKKKGEFANFSFNPIKVLAKGQYGNIYLAYSKQTNFLVVIKSFKKEKVTIQFMIDEFKIQLYCKHPHILPAYGCFFGKSEIYLIMEAGECNMYHEIKHAGYFSESKTATYVHQVLKGLAYLHLNGIIHRDIKPENIILSGGVAKITDFGWSVITTNDRKTYCGTLDYVSPEVSSGCKYDNKIDCWSIGVLAYEMITGFPPFQFNRSKTDRPTLNYHQKIKLPSTLSSLGQIFIMKMLSIDPEDRLSAAQALRDPWILSFSQQFHKKQMIGLKNPSIC